MADATTNRLTARALTLALQGSSIDEAATVLARLAAGDRSAVERARLRIHRGLIAKRTPVGEQAAHSLERALEQLSLTGRPNRAPYISRHRRAS